MFSLFIKFKFLCKNVVSEKVKAYLLQHPPALQQFFNPHLFHFIQKNVSPPPFKKERRDYALYMRDYKGETITLLPFYMTDVLSTEL